MPAVAAFAIEGMRADLYPGLRVSEEKVLGVIEHFRKSARDFHLIAVDGGRIVGAIAAAVSQMLFFERCEATVVMCQATAPGAGQHLIGQMVKWARANMMVRRVVFPQEFHAEPRWAEVLERRYGFNMCTTVLVLNKE